MAWKEVNKTFSSEAEREIFRLRLDESAKFLDLLISHMGESDNRNWGQAPSKYYLNYKVVKGRKLSEKDILG